MRGEVKMGFSFLRRIGNLTRLVHASGGLLFPRGKSNQKRAKTKVLEAFFCILFAAVGKKYVAEGSWCYSPYLWIS